MKGEMVLKKKFDYGVEGSIERRIIASQEDPICSWHLSHVL
jgi:hypothetical protein